MEDENVWKLFEEKTALVSGSFHFRQMGMYRQRVVRQDGMMTTYLDDGRSQKAVNGDGEGGVGGDSLKEKEKEKEKDIGEAHRRWGHDMVSGAVPVGKTSPFVKMP